MIIKSPTETQCINTIVELQKAGYYVVTHPYRKWYQIKWRAELQKPEGQLEMRMKQRERTYIDLEGREQW